MTTIRQAKPSDAKDIQKLLRETWIDTYSTYLSKATLDEVYKNWQSIDFLTKQIENPSFYFPVAIIDGQIAGIATARDVNSVTMIFRLYVSPNFQRQGVGQKLLESVIKQYSKNKKVQIYVEVLNEKGQAFYLKHGFKEIKREEEKVVNEVIEQILMEKEL